MNDFEKAPDEGAFLFLKLYFYKKNMQHSVNNISNDPAGEAVPGNSFHEGDFLILRLLCIATSALYIVAAIFSEQLGNDIYEIDWTVFKYFMLAFFAENVTWAMLIPFLKKFAGTNHVIKAIVWKLVLYVIALVLIAVAIFVYGSVLCAVVLLLAMGTLIAGFVFHIKSAIRMMRFTGKTLPLAMLGQAVIYTIVAAISVGILDSIMGMVTGGSGLGHYVTSVLTTLFSIIPFGVLYIILTRIRKTVSGVDTPGER